MEKCYALTQTGPLEVEFSIPHWTLPRVRERVRVSLINEGTEISLAGPGLHGTFAASYKFLATLPAVGTGPATLREVIRTRQGFEELRVADFMLEQAVAGLNEARLRVLKLFKARQAVA